MLIRQQTTANICESFPNTTYKSHTSTTGTNETTILFTAPATKYTIKSVYIGSNASSGSIFVYSSNSAEPFGYLQYPTTIPGDNYLFDNLNIEVSGDVYFQKSGVNTASKTFIQVQYVKEYPASYAVDICYDPINGFLVIFGVTLAAVALIFYLSKIFR